jgi:hypothetical protein
MTAFIQSSKVQAKFVYSEKHQSYGSSAWLDAGTRRKSHVGIFWVKGMFCMVRGIGCVHLSSLNK